MESKVKLKGHESFSIREGWITKGIEEVENNSKIFSEKDATDILGIGTNMVKSLKYWMLTSGLIEEDKKGEFKLSKLGKLIKKYDLYLEDTFTLYLINMGIVNNTEKAYVWNTFFNKCNLKNFTKKDLLEHIEYILETENIEYNEKMLIDEISTLLKTYTNEEKSGTPENNYNCPLTELNLVKKIDKETYQKEKSNIEMVDPYIVYWGIINLTSEDSISINDLMNGDNSICKELNIGKIELNEFLDELKKEELITVNRTAGLNMVYINKRIDIDEIFKIHFKGE